MLGKIRFLIKKNIYKKRNKNNSTWMVNYFNIDKVKIGKKTWGGVQVIDYELNRTKNRIRIGDYCSIASGVKFMLGGNHRIDRISTFLYKQSGFFQDFSSNGENLVDKGGIEIGNDVWIGYGCLILPGTNIGQGCIIGANSIVAGNVPPYSVYVGNKVIKKRFSDNIIQKLLLVDYNNFDQKVECFPKEMEKYLYSELDEKCLDEFLDFINGKNIE